MNINTDNFALQDLLNKVIARRASDVEIDALMNWLDSHRSESRFATAAAVQAEREACAKVAESCDEDRRGYVAPTIAAAIRARSNGNVSK